MELTWSLDVLYTGTDDEKFVRDFASVKSSIERMNAALEQAKELVAVEGLTLVLQALEDYCMLRGKLFTYLEFRENADTTDAEIASLKGLLGRKCAEATKIMTAMQKYIAAIPDLEQVTETTDFLKEYQFLCLEMKKEVSHMLSDETEAIISKMDLSGATAWENLFSYLVSTVKVDYNGEIVTLSEIRNFAYSGDAEIRKAAYQAELAAYEKVKDGIAFALNSIKNQVTTLSEVRGYDSPLAMTLEQSRMKKETLDAMFEAMRESFPTFRKYMRAKAKLLGHEGGLPWYDLFAPIGKVDLKFTPEEAREYLVKAFSEFAPDSAALIAQAFDERWIDFMPRNGKSGGAFCEIVAGVDESRILTNFSSDFDSVNTLAHELGHAYHNRQIQKHRYLNWDYPMPIAETASTFNETHLAMYALKHAKDEQEKLAILEQFICGTNQTICDIYSRFLFEDRVFNRCEEEFLLPDELCEIMRNAQKEAYGAGLDDQYPHPFMWACKGHYYSGGLSYYNFPYAFGALLSMGLYAMYMKEGDAFLPRYRELLCATPVHSMEDIAAMAGIDLTRKEFWKSSLDAYGELIDKFAALADAQ